MSEPADEVGPLAFGEKVLDLLEETSYTTTYKHAVLLGIIDTLRAGANEDGRPPGVLPVSSIAERVVELYWQQTYPFQAGGGAHVLRQNRGGDRTRNARIVNLIVGFREGAGLEPRTPFQRACRAPGFDRLLRDAEWVLANMPLPRLQRPFEDFIYEIDWSESTARGAYFDASSRSVVFLPGAARYLVALANLLRPIVERRWAALVADMNPTLLEESFLERFLFDPARQPPRRLVTKLRELQEGTCFYCRKAPRGTHVDHFLPWSRTGDDGLDNLVVTCQACNSDKSAMLAGAPFVGRWVLRLRRGTPEYEVFDRLAADANWPRHPTRTLGWARSLYLSGAPSKPVWNGRGDRGALENELTLVRSALAPT